MQFYEFLQVPKQGLENLMYAIPCDEESCKIIHDYAGPPDQVSFPKNIIIGHAINGFDFATNFIIVWCSFSTHPQYYAVIWPQVYDDGKIFGDDRYQPYISQKEYKYLDIIRQHCTCTCTVI
jgi:hypothetical protein